jgi:hypothetical protein
LAADKFESSLGAVRIARRTQGKWLYQSVDDIQAPRALEASVETLDKAVRLRVEGGGWRMTDVEQIAHRRPQTGRKLGASVRSDGVRHPKMADPPAK